MTTKIEVAELHRKIDNQRSFIEEQATKLSTLQGCLQTYEGIESKLDKANILLKMSRGTVKQMERDKQTTRWIYDDVIENMMNRQVMMAAAGWDEYYNRKKAQDKKANES